jgi:hypothetical protein
MASVQIEEAKLSIASLKRSEHDNLQSDLRGGIFRGASYRENARTELFPF